MPEILSELFKEIGMDLSVRNFLIDYCDTKGNFSFSPIQTMPMCSDAEFVEMITQALEGDKLTLIAVTEVFGKCTLEELKLIAESPEKILLYGYECLYYDSKKARN